MLNGFTITLYVKFVLACLSSQSPQNRRKTWVARTSLSLCAHNLLFSNILTEESGDLNVVANST